MSSVYCLFSGLNPSESYNLIRLASKHIRRGRMVHYSITHLILQRNQLPNQEGATLLGRA